MWIVGANLSIGSRCPNLVGRPSGSPSAAEHFPAGWIVRDHLPDRHLRTDRRTPPCCRTEPPDLPFIHNHSMLGDGL